MVSKILINPLSAIPTIWPNTTNNGLSVFSNFVGLALKILKHFLESETVYF